MARGWESKAVESQIESAHDRRAAAAAAGVNMQQLNVLRERERLEHSRVRVLTDLKTATNPRYRAMLEASLEFLDQKLASLR
jgi:hypothetical protein